MMAAVMSAKCQKRTSKQPLFCDIPRSGDGLSHVRLCADNQFQPPNNPQLVLPKPPGLTRGDRMQVIHGPLKGSIAIYQGMRGRQRIEVLLTFLGARQRIVLHREDVRGM
jgi:hypothetical protein